jgi:hypothetical protein
MHGIEFVFGKAGVASDFVEHELRREAGVLAGRSVGEAGDGQAGAMKGDDVDVVARFAPTRKRQDLIDGEVELPKPPTKFGVLNGRKEAAHGVASPFD